MKINGIVLSCLLLASAVPGKTFSSMPESRVGGAAVYHGGKLYYLSGAIFKDDRYAGHSATILSFDPAAGTWSEEGNCPGRSGIGAVAVGEEIFFGGGAMDGDVVSDRHYSWNVVTKKMRETAPLPGPRSQHGVASLDGKVYVAGGGPRNHALLEPSRILWVYDPKTDKWMQKASMSIPMRNLGLVAYGKKLYAIGGHSVGPDNRGQIVQEYNPASDTWRRRADMPTSRTDIAVVVHAGLIYVLGGHPGLAVVESFNPTTNTWRREPDLPQGRFAPAAISMKDGILIFGGLPNRTLRYQPQSNR